MNLPETSSLRLTHQGVIKETIQREIIMDPDTYRREATALLPEVSTDAVEIDRSDDNTRRMFYEPDRNSGGFIIFAASQTEFPIYGSWTPVVEKTSTEDGEIERTVMLRYQPISNRELHNPAQTHGLVMWKTLPLVHWIILRFVRTEWLEHQSVGLNQHVEAHLYTSLAMNGLAPADKSPEQLRAPLRPARLPNIHSNCQICTGEIEVPTAPYWVEMLDQYLDILGTKPSNADIESETSPYWNCDENLELNINVSNWLLKSPVASSHILNKITPML